MDEFCPECKANIGLGVFDAIGCPVCGAEPEDDDDTDQEEQDEGTPPSNDDAE